MLGVVFVVGRGREPSGEKRKSDGPRKAGLQNHEDLTRWRESIELDISEVMVICVDIGREIPVRR